MFEIDNKFVDQCLERFESSRQIDILQEECAELIKACSKFKRADNAWDQYECVKDIAEEMAHVAISSAVVCKILNIYEDDIQKEVDKKAIKYGFEI